MVEAAKLPPPLPLDAAAPGRRPQLGSILLREELLTREQLERALAEKEATGHRLGEIVVAHGWVSSAAVAQALAEQHGLEYVDLAKTHLEPAAANLLPEKFARRYDALPIHFAGEDIVLAVSDPTRRRSSRPTRAPSRTSASAPPRARPRSSSSTP